MARVSLGSLRSVETLEWQLREILDGYRIDCVLDVGAHEGEHSRLLRHLHYRGLILSFEPVEDYFSALSGQAQGDANWNAYQIALGDHECVQGINVTATGHFNSFLKPSDYSASVFKGYGDDIKAEDVYLRRLDNLLDEVCMGFTSKRVFFKLDTRGFDLKVLEGAGKKTRVGRGHAIRNLHQNRSMKGGRITDWHSKHFSDPGSNWWASSPLLEIGRDGSSS